MNYRPPNQADAAQAGAIRKAIPWSIRLVVLSPSLFLYAIACATPAIEFLRNGVDPERWYGIEALLLGWQGVFIGQFGWFANPILLLAYVLILFRRFLAGAIFAIVSVGVAANSLQLFHQHIPGDEGDVTHLEVKAFGIGFYIWVASLLAAVVAPLIGAIAVRYWHRKQSSAN